MPEEAPRREDGERLVAVGRALAQSLLTGPELAGAAARSLGPPLSENSFIPPPAGVEPGSEVMSAPVRRRRRTPPGEWDAPPASHGSAPDHGDLEVPVSALFAPPPVVVAPPPILAPGADPWPEPGAGPDPHLRADAREAFREPPGGPDDAFAAPAPGHVGAAASPESSTVVPSVAPFLPDHSGSGVRVELAPIDDSFALVPSTSTEIERPPVAVPEPVAPSGFVTELYRTLPWSPDEPGPSARRLRLRRGVEAPVQRPELERPDESTVRLPDVRDLTAGAATAAVVAEPEPHWIADHIAAEWQGSWAPELDDEEDDDASEPRRERSAAFEWLLVIGAAFVVAMLIKYFVVQSFSIPSESMVATLEVGDRVAVNKLAYEIGSDVERYDVVVFHHVDAPGVTPPGTPEFLIKRVIGLPGETVEARGGIVYVNGKPLDEHAHLAPDVVTNNLSEPVQVPPGEYFVMGDNRERSGDSRVFGTVPRDHIVGRAVAIWWPLDRAGSL